MQDYRIVISASGRAILVTGRNVRAESLADAEDMAKALLDQYRERSSAGRAWDRWMVREPLAKRRVKVVLSSGEWSAES